MTSRELNLVNRLRGCRPHVLVVGDLILDRYLWGRSERMSPEAPVPVVDVKSNSLRLGGAGNVAANLLAFGATTSLYSVVGTEGAAEDLVRLLDEAGVERSGLVPEKGRPITEKSRVMAGHQQVVRFDAETRTRPAKENEAELLRRLERGIGKANAVVVSDYGKGVCTETLVQGVIERAKALGIPVFCDPKGSDYRKYRGATAVTPNRREAAEATGVPLNNQESLREAGEMLRRDLGLAYCLITLSEDGMALFGAHGVVHIPTVAREVFDVTGAGDTAIAGIAYAAAAGADMLDGCRLANLAAGIAVGKVGSATVSFEEITRHVLMRSAGEHPHAPVVELPQLVELLQAHRSLAERVVFTNGCFDVLHRGHVEYLQAAAELGDVLVVGLNSDASVKRLKGPERPIHGEADRALVLAGLRSVDYVVLFEDDTPLHLIQAVQPDVLVKGGDYEPSTIVGADFVTSRGGRVCTVPLVPGRSSSYAITRMRLTKQ